MVDLTKFHLMLPEFVVAGTALGVILAEILLPAGRRSRATALFSALGLLAAVILLARLWATTSGLDAEATTALALKAEDGPFAGLLLTGWRSDPFSIFARLLAAGGAFLVVLLSASYTRRMDRGHGEFYGLLLFAVLGVMLVAGVSDLLTLFICLELVTISSYVLAAFNRTNLEATEAGLKYLLIGAVSSAILLLGIALTYGAVGEVSFAAIRAALEQGAPSMLLLGGLLLTVVGILFKVGAVPFHVWVPDVYQGAPSPIVSFLATGSKLAGMVLLLRLGEVIFLPADHAAHSGIWLWLFAALAAMTLVFGLLGAIPQRSIKRFFGYSSIGHAGYLLMGLAALAGGQSATGADAIVFYLFAYLFTVLTAFAVIVLVSAASGGSSESIAFYGLYKRSPFLALAMALAMLSLAGIPPLSGFFGKFLILRSVVESPDLLWLAIVGALGVAVSLYFYLMWIRHMYFNEPPAELADSPIRVGPGARIVLVVGIAAMLAMGIFMGPFYDLAEKAAGALGML